MIQYKIPRLVKTFQSHYKKNMTGKENWMISQKSTDSISRNVTMSIALSSWALLLHLSFLTFQMLSQQRGERSLGGSKSHRVKCLRCRAVVVFGWSKHNVDAACLLPTQTGPHKSNLIITISNELLSGIAKICFYGITYMPSKTHNP